MSQKRVCDECGADTFGPTKVEYASTKSGKRVSIFVSGFCVDTRANCDLCDKCFRETLALLFAKPVTHA